MSGVRNPLRALTPILSQAFQAPRPVIAISANGQRLAWIAGSSPPTLFSAAGYGKHRDDHQQHRNFSVTRRGALKQRRTLPDLCGGVPAARNQNVYLYDLQAGTNLLVSQNFSFLATNNASADAPTISPDGRFVAYRSFATNLVPMISTTVPTCSFTMPSSNATYLVSLNASGTAIRRRPFA